VITVEIVFIQGMID